MSRSRSRSTVGSDAHDRLEPRLQKAAEHNDLEALTLIVNLSRENGQFSDSFLRVGLMRATERGCIEATHYLLRQGAKADIPNLDHTGNRPSPLFRAVERNHVRIAQLLLDYGASPETVDKKGRTALMTAAWRNHWHMLDLLIARGANVNAKDKRGRNALHNLAADKVCDWGDDVVWLLLGTACAVDGDEGRDLLGRTPLHWACATGKIRLAELLLMRAGPFVVDIDATEFRNKTALHIAAAHGRDDVVGLLLRYGADLEARSDGGWTALHNACHKGSVPTVCMLLRAGANVNSQLLNGVTPLHLAAQAGHTAIVECLLERPDLKRRIRDNFGSTPFLRAAQFHRKDIVFLLAPFNNVEALSPDAKGACESFEATIVDFGNYHNENRVQKTSVYNLLYGRDKENPRKQAFKALPTDSGVTDFRWIHLPANNMAWVEALLTKAFIEEGLHDVDGFKGLEKSFNYQHRGQWIHSHFMRPICQSTPRSTATKSRDEESSSEDTLSPLSPSITVNGQTIVNGRPRDPRGEKQNNHSHPENNGHGHHRRHSSNKSKKKNTGKTDYVADNASVHSKKKGSKHPETPKGEAKSKSPFGRERHPSTCRDSTASNVCVFMPYLHFETAERRQRMQEAIQRAELVRRRRLPPPPPVPSFTPDQVIGRSVSRDEMLINAHLTSSSTASLHIRRTLDQFFYPNIDTSTRDQDQVVYRYQTRSDDGRCDDPKIFMVDQLWMWILGPNLIVTSFAQRWEQPKNDPLNVLDGVIEDINSKTRDPVTSVYDLAIAITNRCSGVFDRHRMDEEYQFLDMFESAVGLATDRETVLFRQFNAASLQASEWLMNHRKLNHWARHTQKQEEQQKNYRPWILDDTDQRAYHESEEPLFIDKLLDIGQETDLLAEAKDIRDELNIIRTILQHQKDILDDLQDIICSIHTHTYNNRPQNDIKKRFREQHRTIDMHLKDIERMDAQAERVYYSITDLLDLKQKQASANEARFARDQAAGTTRQGKIILVFTIVTIIFLPLSFITSFFTINLAEFPHDADGDTQLHLSYVARYTFGIGFAISIPLIALALAVDDIGNTFWLIRRSCVEQFCQFTGNGEYIKSRAQRKQEKIQDMEYEAAVGRNKRKSMETEFAGSLLPVSTRGTGRTGRTGRTAPFRVEGFGRRFYD